MPPIAQAGSSMSWREEVCMKEPLIEDNALECEI